MGASDLALTVDELVAYIAKTRIPTLLVEGTSDRALLRRVEGELRRVGVDIFPVGGRDRLWEVYCRRQEFAAARVVFLRDRDEWLVLGVPAGYEDFVFTNGYSIENDVLHSDAMRTIAGDAYSKLEALVLMVAEWFRHALQAYCDGKAVEIGRDLTALVEDDNYSAVARSEIDDNPLVEPFASLNDKNVWIWLRGKTLLRVVQSELKKAGPSYSKDQIMDLCLKMGPPISFKNLVAQIESRI